MSAVHINLIVGNHHDSGKDVKPEVEDLGQPDDESIGDDTVMDDALPSINTHELKGIPDNVVENFIREKRLTGAI